MMKISRKADYALRATIFLSNQPINKVHLISEISNATGVSKDFMAKILKDLSVRGLVKAQKGANGGYKLSVPSNEISFKDVVEAIEGPIEINECVPDANFCTRVGSCEMYFVWNKAYKAVADVLEKTKISDLTELENKPKKSVAIS
ncbi:MAG: Rrf2 family transcriptional regulator [Spirochaetota bacterium]|nr:Rrf2 family transcriptional regulator [Spirochaetota bacterium]